MNLLPRVPRARVRTAVAVGAALVGVLAGVAVLQRPQASEAVPVEGHTGWSVLRCKYKGSNAEPQTRQHYEQMFTDAGRNLDTPAGYFWNQSRGRIDMAGTFISDWYTMDLTIDQARARVTANNPRADRIDDCVRAAAAAGYTVPAGNRIIAHVNEQIDSGEIGGRVLLDPLGLDTGFVVHEMSHGYGLGHSFSNDISFRAADWAGAGEYDNPWDEMSAMRISGFPTAGFGTGPVGLNGYHRDKLGWLDRSQVLTFGTKGGGVRDVTLSALDDTGTGGTRYIRIPFSDADPDAYITVEYRRPLNFSRGIPGDQVLIGAVLGGRSLLMRDVDAPDRHPMQVLQMQGVTVQVISASGTTAKVRISSELADRCKQGYVWREARSTDHVCVTAATRTRVAQDNAAAPSRWVRGIFGAHTCVQGYVWRQAFSGDDVCVTADQRSLAASDNAAAESRRVATDWTNFGPNRCAAGYVWREADARDYVCVDPGNRSTVAAENSTASSRWAASTPAGARPCKQGYVWREAFPRDDVCVTPARRTAVAAENRTARDRVANPDA